MLIVFVRTILIYIVLLAVMRFMGKRQIGEMQPFEFIVTLLIAELACIPMADVSIPLLYGIVAIIAIFIIHQILSVLEHAGELFKNVLSGKPALVINKNGIDFYELKKNNLDLEDLIEAMRNLGYFSFEDVAYAIFESNGKLSVLESTDKQTDSANMPLLIVNCGKVVKKNLQIVGKDMNDIHEILKSRKINSLKSVEMMQIDNTGKVYLQQKRKSFTSFNIKNQSGETW